jgi:hypothetical protein
MLAVDDDVDGNQSPGVSLAINDNVDAGSPGVSLAIDDDVDVESSADAGR